MRYLIITLLCMLLSFTAQAYQVNTVLCENTNLGKAEVRLPVIDGSADEDVEKEANALLLNTAKDLVKAVGGNGSVSYEVTLNRPSLLSILLKAENGRSFAYEAVNIDMASGKPFELHDFVMDVEQTKEAFGKCKSVLFTEKGIAKQLKKVGPYEDEVSYHTLLPFLRIGEAGRLLQIARLTDKAEGKTVTLEHCGLVAFKLESNPSTGYTWNLANDPAYFQKVEKVGTSFIIPGQRREDVVGQPGMEILMVAMLEPGKYRVQLEYRRSWEKTSAKRKSFNVIVKDY